MTKEEIVEEIAEGIYQYSSCIEEIVENTNDHLANICNEVRDLVYKKVISRTIEPKKEALSKFLKDKLKCE